MQTVGVRELKNALSHHLAQVKAGKELVVTEHGRPVAKLSPLRELPAGLRELVVRGELTLGRGAKPRGARIPLRGSGPAIAETVIRLRDRTPPE